MRVETLSQEVALKRKQTREAEENLAHAQQQQQQQMQQQPVLTVEKEQNTSGRFTGPKLRVLALF